MELSAKIPSYPAWLRGHEHEPWARRYIEEHTKGWEEVLRRRRQRRLELLKGLAAGLTVVALTAGVTWLASKFGKERGR